jgi:hypothetical protein
MTSKPIREVRRLGALRFDAPPTEADHRTAWSEICQRAYDIVTREGGDHQVTSIEPWGSVSGAFEWRTYSHSPDGLSSVYIAVQETRVLPELDLDEIVTVLREEHDVEAHVEQTGIGRATIYAGTPTRVECTCTRTENVTPHDDTCQVPARGGDLIYPACAGPGTFGWGARPSTASLSEFYVGADDQGMTNPVDVKLIGCRTSQDVARVIAAQARRDVPQLPLGFDEIEALGFDGTCRS